VKRSILLGLVVAALLVAGLPALAEGGRAGAGGPGPITSVPNSVPPGDTEQDCLRDACRDGDAEQDRDRLQEGPCDGCEPAQDRDRLQEGPCDGCEPAQDRDRLREGLGEESEPSQERSGTQDGVGASGTAGGDAGPVGFAATVRVAERTTAGLAQQAARTVARLRLVWQNRFLRRVPLPD